MPTLYSAMLNLPDAAEHDLSSVRLCVSAAEPLAPTCCGAGSAFGLDILDGIGSTEMLHIYCSNRPGDVHPGTSGAPVPGYELRLLDESRDRCAKGEVGNLYVKRRQRARLLLAPAREDEGHAEGRVVLHRRPLPEDEDGCYVYEGRADDMIKVGGLWVSPIEIENVLVEHPRARCAAVGVGTRPRCGSRPS